MKQNTFLLWTLLGAGVAGAVIVARQPDSKLRQKLAEGMLSLKGWADPVVKELLTAQGDAQTRVQTELDALREQLGAVEAIAKEQLDAVKHLKEQAQLGLYSAQYKATELVEQVQLGIYDAQYKAEAIKDQVTETVHTLQEGARAVQDGARAIHGAAVSVKEEAQLGVYSAQYRTEAIKDQVVDGLHDAQASAQALKDHVKDGVQAVQADLKTVHDAAVSLADQAMGVARPVHGNS